MSTDRAFSGASAATPNEQVELYLRGLAAPIVEFIEEASKLDDGYPDRYEGPRNGPFDRDRYQPRKLSERPGYTLEACRPQFSVHDGHGNGRNLRIGCYMRDADVMRGEGEVSMSLILYENGLIEYRGAFFNLPNPPRQGPHSFAGRAYTSNGVWRAMSAIIDTYMFYSHVPERVAMLSKLAGETFLKYYNKEGPTTNHPLGKNHP